MREILFEKHPATSGLRAGDEATFRAGSNLLRVHLQEGGGFIQVESLQRSTVKIAGCCRPAVAVFRFPLRVLPYSMSRV